MEALQVRLEQARLPLIFGVWLPCTLAVFLDQLRSRYPESLGVEFNRQEKSWIRDKHKSVVRLQELRLTG